MSVYDPDADPTHPALLIMWGYGGDGGGILRDSWIFHLNQQQWKKVCHEDINSLNTIYMYMYPMVSITFACIKRELRGPGGGAGGGSTKSIENPIYSATLVSLLIKFSTKYMYIMWVCYSNNF